MLDLYTKGTVEIDGQEYPANAEYEMDECGPSVVSVVALKQVCGEGGWWYDRNGNPQRGPHFERLDVTGWVDLKAWATAIVAYNDYIEGLRPSYRKAA